MSHSTDRPDCLPMGVQEAEAVEEALVRDTILAEAADHDQLDADRILEVCAPSPGDAAIPEAPPAPPTRADVERLRDLRDRVAILKATWDAARDQLEATHGPLLSDLFWTEKAAAEALAAIKTAAEASYAVTGCKKPAPGVEVKIKKTLAYNELEAIDWAQVAAPHLVKTVKVLDRESFEALVWVRPTDYDMFVTVVETPRAQLATDLGKALATADAT